MKMEEKKISINITNRAFQALAKQNMDANHGVCELVDNAIAAAKEGERADVCVAMAETEREDSIWLAVADYGAGMNLEKLQNALQLGSEEYGENRLNEHGFGLDNALTSLTGGKRRWNLFTHDQEGLYYSVKSPFSKEMTVNISPLDLPKNLFIPKANPSTVVLVEVPMGIAQTLQRRGKPTTELLTLKNYLLEHLGVAYRGFLEYTANAMDPVAKIVLTLGKDSVTVVPPIPVPILNPKVERFDMQVNGETIGVEYRYGQLDEDSRNHLIYGNRAKFYYQGTQTTQGVDIRLGGRVISTAQLEQIFTHEGQPLSRHNSFNDFVGEIIIPKLPRGLFSTVNNKTNINTADKDWNRLFEKIDQFPPPHNVRLESEKELKRKWMRLLKAASPSHEVTDEVCVWGAGTRIDVLEKFGKEMIVFELKAGKGCPLDLYQLKMYWDGLVLEGKQPTKGVLLVKEYNTDLKAMAKQMNTMAPPAFPDGKNSLPYHFAIATHEEKCLTRVYDI